MAFPIPTSSSRRSRAASGWTAKRCALSSAASRCPRPRRRGCSNSRLPATSARPPSSLAKSETGDRPRFSIQLALKGERKTEKPWSVPGFARGSCRLRRRVLRKRPSRVHLRGLGPGGDHPRGGYARGACAVGPVFVDIRRVFRERADQHRLLLAVPATARLLLDHSRRGARRARARPPELRG